MGENSGIEWIRGDDGSAGATWNPIIAFDRVSGRRGSFCIHKSEGCRFCWADRMNVFRGTGLEYTAQNLDRHRFEIITDPRSTRSIDWPLRKKKPLRIFPCSMTDLWASWHTDEMIDWVFATMALAGWHTFIITTKEAERMSAYMGQLTGDRLLATAFERKLIKPNRRDIEAYAGIIAGESWPLRNVWLGVSVEDQKTANERIPFLLETSAAVRWVSVEPLLAPVQIHRWVCNCDGQLERHCRTRRTITRPGLDWVVVGGESGPGARPMHPDWVRSIRDECSDSVRFFFKQWGAWQPVCALYPVTEAELNEHERAGCCGDIELQTNGVVPSGYQPSDPRTWLMDRVGKKEAGRILDGREWNEFPR